MNGTSQRRLSTDLELAQCYIRLFVPLPILTLWYVFWAFPMGSADALKALWVGAAFFLFALAHWAHVRRHPGVYPMRRALTIIVDQSACFVAMFLTGELGAVVAFVNLWISVGNGIRFGVRWMVLSAGVAVTGLIVLAAFSDYWGHHLVWVVSLMLLNTAIPAYVSRLIQGVNDSRAQLAQYADKMEKMALKDGLTGLPNRTALFDALEKASAYARRTRSTIAVLYFDLDGFKQVNDALGHARGDILLKETAARVNGILRSEDIMARLGGDEFVVLLQVKECSRRARQVAQRVLKAVASIDDIDGNAVEITASMGIVIVPGFDAARMGAEQVVHEADKNMYRAKKKGKNQIVLTAHARHLTLASSRA